MGKTFTLDPISKRRLDNFGEEDQFYIRDHHEAILYIQRLKRVLGAFQSLRRFCLSLNIGFQRMIVNTCYLMNRGNTSHMTCSIETIGNTWLGNWG